MAIEKIISEMDSETRRAIALIVIDVEPENVDAVVNAIQQDMFVGAKIMIDMLIKHPSVSLIELQSEINNHIISLI